ncbi:MAG: 6,7-dimethyl-8-ribityllumazine synthase, partial [Saprospiraceae bacterium]|nr:6,7-dimethyl-8-ribityllumazine synthase [Saprospiraceae bacterium]
MASALKNLSTYDDQNIPNAEELIFGIIVSDWNAKITHALYEGCYDTLVKHGVKVENIYTLQVPGAFELTVGARILNGQQQVDGMICLGCVIKGETSHDSYINQAVAIGLTNLGLTTGRPHIFGLLTVDHEQQAFDRAGGKLGNKGVEAAVTAIRMASLKKKPIQGNSKRPIGF